ncbi:uncharacterized protein LOC131016866 [Salvia miltiorrhiza]|uniref:uncharacterized protein LOC131016866 n=1 Tax=Salvia miltiorrhiza TaxID=226208 RepID=UPI0025ACFB1C|nr:uncharacterized protein LOC131016866 [Salvia miltiorrhiza]
MSRTTALCRLLLLRRTLCTTPRYSPPPPSPIFATQITRNYSSNFSDLSPNARLAAANRAFDEIEAAAASERRREREAKIRAGIAVDDEEEEEDYLGVGPLIEKYERQNAKDKPSELNRHEEPTDSDSEPEDEEAINMRSDMFQKKFDQFEKFLDKFSKAETFDDAFKWMKIIDEFEEKHFALKAEYRVIGELMNKLKVAEGKEKFLLQVKLNRALRMAEARDAFDPNDPANYGIIEREDDGGSVDREEDREKEEDKETKESEEKIGLFEFDNLKQKDNKYMERINEIDKKLEEKLAVLDYTFGRKGKLLEEEIRDLAEERNALIEQKRQPLYRKGFDVRLVDVNRTCKVTKGGQVIKYTAMLACGNYNGVIGFAKAKAPAVPLALQKAYEKCFQNLHYVERHEDHTIAHAIQTSFKKTKVYLWPAPTQSGMKAGKTVELILNLAGYRNVKSKVVGSRNPHNTVKALFKALNAIETPKDVQEKFGRTVVESYLL